MPKSTITFRTDETRKAELDKIAASLDRDRSYIINEAIDNHLAMYDWQIRHINEGLADLKAGRVVSHEDVVARIAKMREQCK